MRGHLVLIVLALAGCSGAPATAPADAPPATAVPATAMAAVDAFVAVGVPAECPGGAICFGETGFIETLHATAHDAAVTGFHLTLGAAHYQDENVPHTEPVTWSIRCRADDSACSRALLSGTDVLPIDVDLQGLVLPLGADLEMEMETKARAPVAEFFTSSFASSHVTGTVDLALPPGVPALNLTRIPIAQDGHPGPCDLSPDCSHWPGGTQWEHAVGEDVVGFDLNATWTSTTPLDAQIEISVWTADCPASCPPSHRFVGPSPLRAQAADLRYTGISIEIRSADATGLAHGLGGLRTPVHLEGHVVVVIEDECTRVEDGPRTSSC